MLPSFTKFLIILLQVDFLEKATTGICVSGKNLFQNMMEKRGLVLDVLETLPKNEQSDHKLTLIIGANNPIKLLLEDTGNDFIEKTVRLRKPFAFPPQVP